MSGKATLLLIVGFTMIFVVMGYFWGSIATRSVDNHASYFKNTIAHNIAVTGMNLALYEISNDSSWAAGISNRSFENGVMNVSVSILDTISKLVVSRGTFSGVDKYVKVKLMRSSFAKYAWFIASVSTGSKNKRLWVSGDTVWGAFHSNQFLNIDGDPVFFGKVSTEKGLNMTAGSAPEFLGGYVTGVSVPWNNNLSYNTQRDAAAAGQSAGGNCYFDNLNLWLTFNDNGTVSYRTAPRNANDDSSLYSAPITRQLSDLAPTGVIYLDKGDVYLSGTLKGQVTVVSDMSSGNGGGNLYFVGDMVYSVPPMLRDNNGGYIVNNSCTDLMGILATNNVNISSTAQSGGYQNNIVNKDLNVDAGIFCAAGGFNLEGLGTSVNSLTGVITLTGSMTAGKEENVSVYNNDVLTAGYNRRAILDERFLIKPPLWFPYSTGYEVISWLE